MHSEKPLRVRNRKQMFIDDSGFLSGLEFCDTD